MFASLSFSPVISEGLYHSLALASRTLLYLQPNPFLQVTSHTIRITLPCRNILYQRLPLLFTYLFPQFIHNRVQHQRLHFAANLALGASCQHTALDEVIAVSLHGIHYLYNSLVFEGTCLEYWNTP